MVFTPENTIIKSSQYIFGSEVSATAPACMDKEVLKQLWNGSTYRTSKLTIKPSKSLTFTIGTAEVKVKLLLGLIVKRAIHHQCY